MTAVERMLWTPTPGRVETIPGHAPVWLAPLILAGVIGMSLSFCGCASFDTALSPEPAASVTVDANDYRDRCPICEDTDVIKDQCRLSAVSPSFNVDAVDQARIRCFYSCSQGHQWAVRR